MANVYFNHAANVVSKGVRALASHVNNVANEIGAGFDKLPTEIQLKEGRTRYAVDTGGADAYVVTLPHVPTLTDGFRATFKATTANTGASTIDYNGLGAKALKYGDGSVLPVGAIVVDQILETVYESTSDSFLIMSVGTPIALPVVGIRSTATGERLLVSDSALVVGSAGVDTDIIHAAQDRRVILSGGNSVADGGAIHMSGSTRSVLPGAVQLKSNGNVWLAWDESAGDLEILTGVGVKTSALTIDASQNAVFAGDVNIADTFSLRWGDGNERITGNNAGLLDFYTNNIKALFIDPAQAATFAADVTVFGPFIAISDLTVQGAFTSLGIDDNATGERLQVADTLMRLGASGSGYSMSHSQTDQDLRLYGGSTSALGGGIQLWAESHATLAGDVALKSSANAWMQWDESVGALEILTGVGVKTSALTISPAQLATFAGGVTVQGAFTSRGIDDNATIEKMEITDAALILGSSGGSYGIQRSVDTLFFGIHGGTANGGGGVIFYGGSHAGFPGDILLRSGLNAWMKWDESVGDLEILTGVGVKTSALTIDASQVVDFANPPTIAGEGGLAIKVIDIGDWNMNTTSPVVVAHGLTLANIRCIRALIRDDVNTGYYDIMYDNSVYSATGAKYILIDTTNIHLARETSGFFDSVAFQSTSYNRGWVTIWHVP